MKPLYHSDLLGHVPPMNRPESEGVFDVEDSTSSPTLLPKTHRMASLAGQCSAMTRHSAPHSSSSPLHEPSLSDHPCANFGSLASDSTTATLFLTNQPLHSVDCSCLRWNRPSGGWHHAPHFRHNAAQCRWACDRDGTHQFLAGERSACRCPFKHWKIL